MIVIPDESAYGADQIRYPARFFFFLDSPPQADLTDSGMTDVLLVLQI
jgi:hypothetical protein